ncbi:MAG: hypothetical protein IJ128_00125 [Firmicutes bacterium]|nr:hypothetical protein [Bacillota bacterium]
MSKNNSGRSKFTTVSIWHFIRLGYRAALFVVFAVIYIDYRMDLPDLAILKSGAGMLADLSQSAMIRNVVLGIIWIVFMVEMFLRLFPSRLESPGCQKQFAENYMKSGSTQIVIPDNNATMLVALIWVCFNLFFGALYMIGILDSGIMILLSCAFAVCDMICILFFCPFQTWFLHNKCCGSCRIYNWDYAMMFTPLFFVRSPYTWSLLIMSIVILVRWEVTFYRFPERFSEKTNEYLRCENCTEKLCSHKKQLHSLWKQVAQFTSERTKRLRREEENQ